MPHSKNVSKARKIKLIYHSCNDAIPRIMGPIVNTLFGRDERERPPSKVIVCKNKGMHHKINIKMLTFLRYCYMNQLSNV